MVTVSGRLKMQDLDNDELLLILILSDCPVLCHQVGCLPVCDKLHHTVACLCRISLVSVASTLSWFICHASCAVYTKNILLTLNSFV